MNTQPSQDVLDKAVESFNVFCSRNPDFYPCDANAQLLANAVKRLNLDFSEVSSLQHAWVSIKPKGAPARKPAPVAATPAPAVRESLLSPERIDAESRRRIAEGEISREIVSNWSAKELLRHSQQDLATARAIEILYERKPVEPSRGDVNHSFGVATRNHTDLGSEIIKTVDARLAPTVQAQNPNAYSPNAARRSGILSTHDMATYSTKRKPSLAQAIARQKEDQKFLDEAAAKTARLIRVKANKVK